jgi:hypothetical protein
MKQWWESHHGAVLAVLVAVSNLPFLKGTAKVILTTIAAAFQALG